VPDDALVRDDELPHAPAFDLVGDLLRHRHDRES
jgi:hypothetical protein